MKKDNKKVKHPSEPLTNQTQKPSTLQMKIDLTEPDHDRKLKNEKKKIDKVMGL